MFNACDAHEADYCFVITVPIFSWLLIGELCDSVSIENAHIRGVQELRIMICPFIGLKFCISTWIISLKINYSFWFWWWGFILIFFLFFLVFCLCQIGFDIFCDIHVRFITAIPFYCFSYNSYFYVFIGIFRYVTCIFMVYMVFDHAFARLKKLFIRYYWDDKHRYPFGVYDLRPSENINKNYN